MSRALMTPEERWIVREDYREWLKALPTRTLVEMKEALERKARREER